MNMNKRNILILVLVSVIGLFSFTNPSKEAHTDAIIDGMDQIFENMKPKSGWELIGWNAGKMIAHKEIKNSVKRNNYILFSTVTADNGRLITLGILGNVKFYPKIKK